MVTNSYCFICATTDGSQRPRDHGGPHGRDEERRLEFLILALPQGKFGPGEIISVSFREGIDFIDEPWPEFGNFYVLETA